MFYILWFFSSIRSFDFICLCPFTTPNFPLVCKKKTNVIQPYITINFQDSRREFQHFPLVSPPFFSCTQLPKSHLHLRSHFDRQALALYSWAVIHQLMEVQLGLLFSPTFLDVFPQQKHLWLVVTGTWLDYDFPFFGECHHPNCYSLHHFSGLNTNQTSISGEFPRQPWDDFI